MTAFAPAATTAAFKEAETILRGSNDPEAPIQAMVPVITLVERQLQDTIDLAAVAEANFKAVVYADL